MKRILLVDDEPELREAISEALRLSDFEVIEATDGAAGLTLARSHPPDLIISDVKMDRMSGTELLMALRADPAIAATPFILITGDTDKTSLRKGMRLGADDYLAKPFKLSELLEAVQARLRKHEQTRAQADAKVSELRANLSLTLPHELLTPLTCVLGYSEMILTDFDQLQPDQILDMTAEIQKCGQRLLRLTQNYLFYAGIELARFDPQRAGAFRNAHLDDTTATITKTARRAATPYGRGRHLVFRLEPLPAAISEEYLAKILEELVDNACKFSPPSVPVEITTLAGPLGFRLMISDHGAGMTPAQIAQVGAYQQFERDKREQQGMGLGLAIAKKLAEVHGGTLRLANGEKAGLIVTIDLPSRVNSSGC